MLEYRDMIFGAIMVAVMLWLAGLIIFGWVHLIRAVL